MDELQKMVSEITELEAFTEWRSGRTAVASELTREDRLVNAVRTELLHASILTAVAAGLANALERAPGSILDVAAIATYAPSHTGFFRRSLDTLLERTLSMEDGVILQSYLARLDLAVRMSRTIAARRHLDGGATDPEILADAWRRVAADAASAIEAFVDLGVPHIQPAQRAEAGRVLGLLRLAKAGHSPCLGADGRITIPGWAERRRAGRRIVNLAATLVAAGRTVPVTVRDISASGLGLEGDCKLEEGTEVSVRLAGNRQLAGRIAWCSDRRIGLELAERLDVRDPLLAPQ